MSKLYFAFVLALCALPLSAGAQSTCSFTLFQIPNYSMLPSRIDRYGNVVGEANGPNGAVIGFIRASDGSITQYSAPNSVSTALADRNSSGEMVGSYMDSSQTWHGFILQNNTFTVVDYPGATYTNLNGINDSGTIVGIYQTSSSSNYQGFELAGGTYAAIAYPGAAWTVPEGINDRGEITGDYAVNDGLNQGFVFSNAKYITLNDPSGKSGTTLEGNNTKGEIVGDADISLNVPTQGFLYRNGQFTNIVVPNASFDTANGINIHGVITGAASFSAGYQGYIATCR
jgi:hypothetical protein